MIDSEISNLISIHTWFVKFGDSHSLGVIYSSCEMGKIPNSWSGSSVSKYKEYEGLQSVTIISGIN